MVINACFVEYANVNIAEVFTQPVDYFEFGDGAKKVSLYTKMDASMGSDVSLVIIGGGGIARTSRLDNWVQLNDIVDCISPTVPIAIWGMGINDHGRLDRQYDDRLASIRSRHNVLVGLRDSFDRNYVPCVSCMRSEFDTQFTIERVIGFYAHHLLGLELPYPTMTNYIHGDPQITFKNVIRFLGTCDVVVTNSYHGAYWATLLNRKVIVVAPFSNKFMGLKYEPIIVQSPADVNDAARIAKRYPAALAESRAANVSFCERVRQFRDEFSVRSRSV